MDRRQKLIQLLTTVATIALSVLAARFGIPLPPIQVPPSVTVTPPPISVNPIVPAPVPPGHNTLPPSIVPTAPTLPPDVPTVKVDPYNATVKLIARGHYCTATVIGPRDASGRQWVLTAAHCVDQIGERQSIKFRDGRETVVECVAIFRGPDYAWCRTVPGDEEYPFTYLYDNPLQAGQRVYHTGYGVHKPGNKETGTVDKPEGGNGRYHFRLSVSHGDSGSGIIDAATGKVVGVVSTGSGRDPSPWTNGPAVPTVRIPDISGVIVPPPST